MPLKHKTLPAGTDRPGFAGVTPSLYAEEHLFSGGAHGSVLTRDTGATDGAAWVATANGVLTSTGAATAPTFATTLPNAVQDNITRVGTLVSGATGAGFTVALSTSTITGTLADARLSSNVPLKDAANTFTAAQTVAPTGDVSALLVTPSHATYTGNAIYVNTTRAANAAFNLLTMQANGVTQFSVTGAGVLTVSGLGAHTFSASGVGTNTLRIRNTSAGTANAGGVFIGNDVSATSLYLYALSSTYTSSLQFVQGGAVINAEGSGGLSIAAEHASGAIRFYSGGTTLRMTILSSGNISFVDATGVGWGDRSAQLVGDSTGGASYLRFDTGGSTRFRINHVGDWLNGSNIMDSTGTPTIASGFGTSPSIAGNDYAMKITNGTTANASGNVTFGRTWTNAPICTANWYGTAAGQTIDVQTDTTTLFLRYPSTTNGAIYVLCRGY